MQNKYDMTILLLYVDNITSVVYDNTFNLHFSRYYFEPFHLCRHFIVSIVGQYILNCDF